MDPLRVLFVQNQVCSRTWRHAKVLADAGHHVALFETGPPAAGYDYSCFAERHSARVGRDLRSMVLGRRRIIRSLKETVASVRPDLLHTNNGPDNLAAWALEHIDLPLVHDVHDLWSATPVHYVRPWFRPLVRRLVDQWEKRAVEGADLVLAVSESMVEYLRHRYRVRHARVIENKSIAQRIVSRPKLSATDGRIHVVYAGGINTIPGSTRDFLPGLKRIAADDVVCHIYPITFTKEDDASIRRACAEDPNLVHHEPVPYEEVIPELTQYDYGYLYYDTRDENILIASPTKLFQYLLAGLPVIVHPEGRIGAFVRDRRCGIVVDSLDDVRPRLQQPAAFDIPTEECVLDANDFVGLYKRVLEGDPDATTPAAMGTAAVARSGPI